MPRSMVDTAWYPTGAALLVEGLLVQHSLLSVEQSFGHSLWSYSPHAASQSFPKHFPTLHRLFLWWGEGHMWVYLGEEYHFCHWRGTN